MMNPFVQVTEWLLANLLVGNLGESIAECIYLSVVACDPTWRPGPEGHYGAQQTVSACSDHRRAEIWWLLLVVCH
jgi:hypothetical protein